MCRGGFPKHYHMKPKTTYQKRIVKLNKSVEALSENIIEWAKESAITHPAVRRKNNVTVCPMCGNAMVYAGNARKVKCLECERTLQVIEADTWKSIRDGFRHSVSSTDCRCSAPLRYGAAIL